MYKKYVEKRSADDILSEEGLLSKDVVPQQPLHKCLSLKKILLAHLLILALYTFLFLYAWRITAGGSCSLIQRGGNEVYFPAARVIEVETQTIDLDSPNSFKGEPSPEVEDAWNELLHGYNIRIPGTILNEMGRHSIPLADGSGDYWGILASTHNLHCLREIKEALALEHHVSNITKNSDDPGVRPPHIDHCIESLRQYIMCKADATMLTWYWPDEEPQPGTKYHPRTNYTFQQQCMNWPKLQDWAISNSFQLSPETIFHPKYGYPW